jgi:hypothetical protein
MAPHVELSTSTFSRLQAHAIPLIDTIESVINRMIDSYEKTNGASAVVPEGAGGQTARVFNPDAPPDLTHAKILGVTFCGKPLGRGQDNWNDVPITKL